MNKDKCPIFPLKSIVLPGGVFPLRIFERRYLDMVTSCIRENTGFCIALVQKEDENRYIDQVYDVMSYVEITDWNKLEDGIFGISVEGKTLAKVKKCALDENNLLIGQIEVIEPEKEFMVPQKYQLLSKFYRKIYPGIKDYINFKNERYADASWVGYRLTECLPLDLKTKASLISLDDAILRLERIYEIVNKLYKNEIKQL